MSWSSFSGSKTTTLSRDSQLENAQRHVMWNDAAYRVYEGNVSQSCERGFDVDRQDRPVMLATRWRQGTGNCIDTEDSDAVPVACSQRTAPGCRPTALPVKGDIRYHLFCRRWDVNMSPIQEEFSFPAGDNA